MHRYPRQFLHALLLVLVAAGSAAAAEPFPTKPIHLVSPFPPGGANDILARLVAQKLTTAWGQAVVVDNRPGAAGGLGTALVANAPPDGYTLVMGTLATHGINPSVYKSLPYDPVKGFAPVAMVAVIPIVIVVNPSLPALDAKQLIQLAKRKPGELNFASSGLGSVNHLAGELFKSMAGVDLVHIPYKGSAPALTDLLSGNVTVMFDLLPSSLPYIQAGKLRALAVTSARRSTLLPDVPTLAESGLTGYEVNSWFGVLAPAGTPVAIVNKLNAALGDILRAPDVREQMAKLGAEPLFTTPDEFSKVIGKDLETWAPIVGNLGLRQ